MIKKQNIMNVLLNHGKYNSPIPRPFVGEVFLIHLSP